MADEPVGSGVIGDAMLSAAKDDDGRTISHEREVSRLVSEAADELNLDVALSNLLDSGRESALVVESRQPGGMLRLKLGLVAIQSARPSLSSVRSGYSGDSLRCRQDGCVAGTRNLRFRRSDDEVCKVHFDAYLDGVGVGRREAARLRFRGAG